MRRIGIEIGRVQGRCGQWYNHIGIDHIARRTLLDRVHRFGIEFGIIDDLRSLRRAPYLWFYYKGPMKDAGTKASALLTIALFSLFMFLAF